MATSRGIYLGIEPSCNAAFSSARWEFPRDIFDGYAYRCKRNECPSELHDIRPALTSVPSAMSSYLELV